MTNTPKKEEKNYEQIIEETAKDCLEICKKSHQLLVKCNAMYEKMEKEMRDLKRDSVTLLKTVTQKFTYQNQLLEATRKMTTSADDTLCNVLLAIRQNEYLQAYYPEQHGYPEMKLSGTHPAKIYGKNKVTIEEKVE